jgi:hypothetical protein
VMGGTGGGMISSTEAFPFSVTPSGEEAIRAPSPGLVNSTNIGVPPGKVASVASATPNTRMARKMVVKTLKKIFLFIVYSFM